MNESALPPASGADSGTGTRTGSDAGADRADVAAFLRSRGEREFLRLYDRHGDALYRFAARLTGDSGDEAQEIVQETWLRALARFGEFRWESSLRTWLCGIAMNLWRERRQRAGRERAFAIVEGGRAEAREREVLDASAAGASGASSSAHGPALALALERALEALPDGYREVLLLHDLEGYTHEEIARHFGIVEGTSKSQLHRARKALRDALAERGVAHHG